MAKTEDCDSDSSMAENAMELKKELNRLVKEIIDDEDCGIEVTDEAMRMLSSLKEMKFKEFKLTDEAMRDSTPLKEMRFKEFKIADEAVRIVSSLKELKFKEPEEFNGDDMVVPEEFKCPISKEIMVDPVVLSTGQTYERRYIEKWLNKGHRTCPQTQQVLAHTVVTPNHLVREMISKWCTVRGIEIPKTIQDIDEDVINDADHGHVNSLLEKISSSESTLLDQKKAAKELRLLTKWRPSIRAIFCQSSDAISQLVSPLLAGMADVNDGLQEDLITTVLNIAIHEDNKRLLGENPIVLSLLLESLKIGTVETKSNAAAALFTLSALDSNKLIIGQSGALKLLIDLLEEGNPLAIKDAASAIFNLCTVLKNKERAVSERAIEVILKKVVDGVLVNELLAVLALLSSYQNAVDNMGELDAVPALLKIIRESTCEVNKENCIVILYAICVHDWTKWRSINEDEKANGTLSKLAWSGTSRAKRKATGLLEMLNKTGLLKRTAS